MSRRKKHRSGEDVELNLAAMLDMAFQLLTFFILTFRPAPVEGQISMRLPPPQAIAGGKVQAGSDTSSTEAPAGVNTLLISVFANPGGDITGLGVGETPLPGVTALDNKLREIFRDPSNPFDQVIIQVGADLRYEELMRIVEICAAQVLPDGSRLSKLSFVEVPAS